MSVALMMIVFWLGFRRFDLERDQQLVRGWTIENRFQPPAKKRTKKS
jgi:hypothetical protein